MSLAPLKVLFVAFGCEPGRGSEPGVGWGFVDEASRRRPVWVLTHAHQKPALDHYLATQHKHYPIHPIYVSLPGLGWLWKSHFGINFYYYLWQLKAGRIARKLHQSLQFDLVQHVSFTRYWMQSAGALVGAPFVFGPVGGGDSYPQEFRSELTFLERMREHYWLAVRRVMEHDPLLRRTLRRASVTIASGHYAIDQLSRLGAKNIKLMSAVAPTPELPPPGPGPGPNDVFRFVSIGRVPRWKGVHLGLQAFAKAFGPGTPHAGDRSVEYTIIGDGADLPRLKSLAAALGVADRVRFEGDLPYTQCLESLTTAGAMIHPALRDSAGVVFEALSLGVPVACCDIGTPSLLVDETSGAIIPSAGGPTEVVSRLAEILIRWRTDVAAYRRMRQGAVARSVVMSRRARGDALDAIYGQMLNPSSTAVSTAHSAATSKAAGGGAPAKMLNGCPPLAGSGVSVSGSDRTRL